MISVDERLARLEERVFVNQTDKIEDHAKELDKLSIEIKALNSRLNYLIILLVGNFGLAFFKVVPALSKFL